MAQNGAAVMIDTINVRFLDAQTTAGVQRIRALAVSATAAMLPTLHLAYAGGHQSPLFWSAVRSITMVTWFSIPRTDSLLWIFSQSYAANYVKSYWKGHYSHDTFAASYFLRKIVPPHCLQHIRFLEVVFAQFDPRHLPSRNHPAMRDWSQTISWLKDSINLSALTLHGWLCRLSTAGQAGITNISQRMKVKTS